MNKYIYFKQFIHIFLIILYLYIGYKLYHIIYFNILEYSHIFNLYINM